MLNKEKCEVGKRELKFLGFVIDGDGIWADPDKTQAIQDMESPTSVTDLRRFMGMVNQLGKFSPNLAELSQPLRSLLRKDQDWIWGPHQEEAFTSIKNELSKPTVLALYDPNRETKISADASSYGLGAVLLQKIEGEWRPIAYASRSILRLRGGMLR